MPDALPDEGTLYSEQDYPDLMRTVREGPRQFRLSDSSVNPRIHSIITAMKAQSILVVPLIYEEDLLGMLILCESRNNRQFQPDEISLVRSMALQATVALQQATLFANVRELEQVKSEMIRMASHDLRNPLHSVKGYLELLLMDLASRLDAQQTEFVTRMKNGLNRMQSLMEDILNLEKIESQQDIKRQPANMWMVVSEVSESGRSQADLKHQQYIVNLPPQSVLVSGSEIQLTQAFTNLVGNAIKYTPDEGRVEVRSWVENGRFRFEVEDSGFGIPQDRQNGLFQRFYRAQAPGTEDIPGTGLGLSLVKAVIERHGGEVYFSSTPGVGSVFGCWLPLTDTQ
ncbi:MAG: GAF domain-containing protein, partial [Anaerolineae bacterium]